jgi:hypothetical protein
MYFSGLQEIFFLRFLGLQEIFFFAIFRDCKKCFFCDFLGLQEIWVLTNSLEIAQSAKFDYFLG